MGHICFASKENSWYLRRTLTDGPRDYNTKQSKTERERYHDIAYILNLKYEANESTYETDSQT